MDSGRGARVVKSCQVQGAAIRQQQQVTARNRNVVDNPWRQLQERFVALSQASEIKKSDCVSAFLASPGRKQARRPGWYCRRYKHGTLLINPLLKGI